MNNLTGSIPSVLGAMTALLTLGLWDNNPKFVMASVTLPSEVKEATGVWIQAGAQGASTDFSVAIAVLQYFLINCRRKDPAIPYCFSRPHLQRSCLHPTTWLDSRSVWTHPVGVVGAWPRCVNLKPNRPILPDDSKNPPVPPRTRIGHATSTSMIQHASDRPPFIGHSEIINRVLGDQLVLPVWPPRIFQTTANIGVDTLRMRGGHGPTTHALAVGVGDYASNTRRKVVHKCFGQSVKRLPIPLDRPIRIANPTSPRPHPTLLGSRCVSFHGD
jgi:hypothetical protein